MRSRKRQAGVSLALLAVVILVVVAAIVAVKVFDRTETAATRGEGTRLKFNRVHAALLSFVTANGRLPCPASPTLDVGLADPPGATVACNSPGVGGTIPWATLGMNRDDAYDAWGWKISYHVFSGGVGSLTQTDGASMVKCECDYNAAGVVCELAQTAPTAAGLCTASVDPLTYGTPETAFLQGKGLQVTDFGTLHTDAAYVLVSHGPSGLRAYTAAGVRLMAPAMTSADEIANTADAGPFVARAPSSGLPPEDANYFDDLISYVTLADLLRRAGQGARDWPESAPPARVVIGYTMDNATVATAVGHAVAAGSLGDDRVDFGSGTNRARVQGSDSGGNQDISYNTAGGAPSLGVTGNGNSLLTNFSGEKLRIDFARSGSKFGVALADFGTYDLLGTTYIERVQFRFSGGASTVTVIKSGCNADGGVATFSIDPGTDFDRVEITALSATPSPFAITALALADFRICDTTAAACLSTLTTAANRCP